MKKLNKRIREQKKKAKRKKTVRKRKKRGKKRKKAKKVKKAKKKKKGKGEVETGKPEMEAAAAPFWTFHSTKKDDPMEGEDVPMLMRRLERVCKEGLPPS